MGFLNDIAELARAGYSVSDVKELLAMNKEQPKEQPKETEEAKEEEVDTTKEVPETETKEVHKEEPEVDYKAEYEKLLKEKNAADLHKDLSGIDKALSNEEQIEKMFKEIL